MYIDHFLLFQGLEFVTVDESKTYFVNREQEQLENVDNLDDILPLVQVQYGSLPDGDVEILERYCDPESDDGVMVDASPAWLLELQSE